MKRLNSKAREKFLRNLQRPKEHIFTFIIIKIVIIMTMMFGIKIKDI